jgi:hypothetical protein
MRRFKVGETISRCAEMEYYLAIGRPTRTQSHKIGREKDRRRQDKRYELYAVLYSLEAAVHEQSIRKEGAVTP